MNQQHALCASPEWAEHLQVDILPALTTGIDLGDAMIEVGSGPGAATAWLRHRVMRLVVVEIEADAAERLRQQYENTNVEVVTGDATHLPFADDAFDSAGSFTMLHHVPTVQLQNRLLCEVLRVLKPGGVLIGSDSLPSDSLHHFHEGDIYNPVDPGGLMVRLQTLGFENISVTVRDILMFTAHKCHPAAPLGPGPPAIS